MLPAGREADRRHLAVRRPRPRDRVDDDLPDVPHERVDAREPDVARMRAPLAAQRVRQELRALLVEREHRDVRTVAAFRMSTRAVRLVRPKARVRRIVQAVSNRVERPYPSRLGAKLSTPARASDRCRLSSPPSGAGCRRSNVDGPEPVRPWTMTAARFGTSAHLPFAYTGRTRCTRIRAGSPSNRLSGISPGGTRNLSQ
ncbi:hypothetical protein [Streptomyces sp. NPDC057854]|uniref:hypothetical protein n=1 Tax=unclassified Streptomyces TaxID=2593676 RepID=UPI0036BFA10E